MNRSGLGLVHWATLVNGRTQHVHDPAQSGFAHRHGDGCTRVGDHQATAQTVRGAQRNGPHNAVAQLLLHFERQGRALEFERIVNTRHVIAGEFDVHHRTNTLDDFSLNTCVCHCLSHDGLLQK